MDNQWLFRKFASIFNNMNYCYYIPRIIFVFLTFALFSLASWANEFVVVIDAGHGGHDSGAVGAYAQEKDITLKVAKLLGKKIDQECDNIKVVYTRNKDKYLTLQQRANIANKANGDLFISIHVNSVDLKSPGRTKVAGASVFTLGLHRSDDNLAVAKRENSVIELENDYTTTYSGFNPNSTESYIIFELSQNKHMMQSIEFASSVQNELISTAQRANKGVRQAGFWVLWATSMPSVLIELDFICNPTQEEYLASTDGQEQLAQAIYNAFQKYYYSYNKTQPKSEQNITRDSKEDNKANINNNIDIIDNSITYRIQILTSKKPLKKGNKEFKGLSPIWNYIDNGMYKYTVGSTQSIEEAKTLLKNVQKKFEQAFIVKFQNGKRIK